MFLAAFPNEIISQLSKQLIFTDFIILHACGNALLNEKMRTAPISVRALTRRCTSYYNLKLTRRFDNILHVVFKPTTSMNHIPNTARTVITSTYLTCAVPESVDVLSARCITNEARFERKPGELEVTTEYGSCPSISYPDYITHLLDHTEYSRKMVNLKSVCVASNSSVSFEPVDGVKIVTKVVPCSHRSSSRFEHKEDSIWSAQICNNCNSTIEVVRRFGGSVCYPIPPCDQVTISGTGIEYIKLIFKMMSPGTKTVYVQTCLDEMNKLCKSDAFDLIPTSIEKLVLDIQAPLKSSVFDGVPKSYPFIVSIDANKDNMEIADCGRIDECDWTMFKTSIIRLKLTRKYPRLNFNYL